MTLRWDGPATPGVGTDALGNPAPSGVDLTRRTPTCSHPAHPTGSPTGAVVRLATTATFRHRICGTCGGSQGVARVKR